MEEQPLHGILVAVPATRRAAETEALIRRWGGTCIVGPLLEVLRAGHVIARGPKSAAALAESGLTPEWTPPGETSAEMATWLRPQVGPGDTVSLQLYGEPVPGLTRTLAATGARVVEIAPYRWALPADPARREAAEGVVRSIATAGVQAIVVTSAVQAM